jgi:hypothetical protein
LATLALFTLTVGCASEGEPAPSRNHPASPLAAETPAPEASTALEGVDAAAPAGGAPAPDAADHDHDHVGADASAPPVAYTCPHHPRVMQAEAGECPSCGMALVPTTSAQTSPLRRRDDNPSLEAPEAEPEAPEGGEGHEHGGHQ